MAPFQENYQAWKDKKSQSNTASATFEKGYQAWKERKGLSGSASRSTSQSPFELSRFDQNYIQWQLRKGKITQEQALEQLSKPYTDFINQVNGVISGYEQFANNYNTRFGGRKYDMSDAYVGDSQQYLDEATAYNQQLIAQSNAILATLEANPDAFDKETVEEIKRAMTVAQENAAAILKVAGEDNTYWNSWGNGAIDHEQELEEMQLLLAEWDATGALRNSVEQGLPLNDEQQERYNRLVAAMEPYGGYREGLENAIAEKQKFLDENPDWRNATTAESMYLQAQQDQTYANKYNGVSGVKLLDVINFLDDGAEKEWVTGQALRTMAFDEAQAVVETMEQEFRELSQTGTLRNAYATGMYLTPEEKAAAEAAIAQYEAVLKKYGIDTKDEDAEPMEAFSNLIQQRKTLIAESKKMQEYVRLSSVQENKDFAKYVEEGKAEAIEYAEKNKKTDHMTNKEIDVLAYYIGKDKENGTNTAETYKDAVKHYLKHRRAQEIADNINGMDIPVIEGLTRIGYSYLANMVRFGRDVAQNFNFGDEAIGPTVFELGSNYAGAGKDLNWFDRTTHKVAGVMGYMTPALLTAKLTGGATGIASLGKAAGSAMMFLGSAGSAYGEALDKGYDKPAARAYSALVGLSEVALQNVLGGISEFGGLPAMLEGKIAAIKKVLLRTAAKYGVSIVGEEIEENLQNFLEPAIRTMVLGEEYDKPTMQEIFDTIITTALSTSGMEGPGIVKDTIKDAKLQKLVGDQITQHSFLTSRERVVVNTITQKLVAEAEQGGKKLSADEKQKIYDQVVDDMDTGRIDIQQIEEAIGKGTEYEQLVSEHEELKKLNSMKPMEMTGDQLNRRDELREKNIKVGEKYGHYGYRGYEEAIKRYDAAFSQAVEGLVKSDRLSESYRERDRRSEAYKVEDLNQYSEAQRQTIQAAMDSGILNNTRRTHEFVELIAKLSEKMGVKFNFTDNQRLKESGFAIDGVTVNGYVNQDGITINVNSAKALNRVVGHEITHILEGTGLYDRLAMAVAAYAKTKGEYESRLQQIRELYKGKEGYTGEEGANTKFQAELNAEAKFEKELVADLVGDYIFTDKAFVEKLFQEEPGLFKRIFEEIKYLCKLVTAGSKEARQLEKSKKMFEKVVSEAKKNGVKNPTAEGQTENGIYEKDDAVVADMKEETIYSLTNNQKFMDKAIEQNRKTGSVSESVMLEAKASREKVATRLTKIRDEGKVAIPEDVEGNTFFGNSAYGGSEENTTICPRSLAAEAFVDAVSELVGRPLTWEEQIYISQDLQQPGRTLTPECIYCYVATDRKAYRVFLGEYIKQRDAVIDAYKNGNTDTARSGSLYQEFLNGRKDTDNMWKRFSTWINAYKNGTPMVKASHLTSMEKLMGDIQSEFGKELKAQIKDAMAYAQSASWAKKRVGYVAYNGHILKWKQDRINKLNSHYGLRMYSFSDFSPAFILENMQMITDAAVRGLKMLGYTKELDFVKIFAPSGMNINISTFGFEMAGNVYENNIIGANWTEAQKLRAKHPNVGITFVATNDTLVEWALEQDWIDVVIPLHLVRTGKELVQKLGFKDYTGESADVKTKDWMPGDQKSIAPTEHNNDKATYLEALQKNHLRPRFERYIDNPNYMKLVNECRQSASESKAVQPIFDETAANESLAKLEANGYYQPIGGSVDRMYEIAADVADNIVKKNGIYSLSAPGQVEAAGGGWDVRGQDVGLPMRSGYQESPVAVGASQQAQPVNLPGLEKNQPQSQGVTQEAKHTMPKQSQRPQIRGNALVDEVLPMPGDTVRAEQQRLDDEYRRQAGLEEDPSLYDPDEDEGVETVRDRLEVKQKNLQWELQENQRGKETALQAKDQLITELQAKYDAKKHKDSKNSQALLRRIQRETRLKSDIAAEYDQKIARIQTRIGILEEKLQTSKPEKQDRLEQAYQKIDAQLDYDERELAKEYYAKRGELQKDLGTKDQNTWVGDKARDLLWEMANWEKGQRPSKLLGALWDTKYDWTALKHALADIKDGYTILPSPAENAVRDVLNRAYADRVQEMKDLDTRYEEDLELLRKEAQEQKDKAKLAESRRGKQQQYTAEVAELVGDTTTWKDKKLGISYQTNTLRRNLRYVVRDAFGKPDIQKADAIDDYLQGSYNRNEAELNRESARIKDPYSELKITKAEDAYIQMLGELRHNPDTELLPEQVEEFYQAHKDNIDKAKVDKVIDMARKTYDSLLIRLNEVLQAQGMKEIPYRKGYFPHFTEDKQGWFAKILNWKVNKNQLPTDIAGLTETYQPQRSWQRFNKQRMSDTTDYSFMKGMDNYVQGALDWIYHIEDIQKRRAFENYLRYIHSDKGVQKRIDEVFASHAYDATEAQEQIDLILKEKENPLNNFVTDLRTGTNLLAGKKHSKDRNMEMDMNREVYSTMTNISSRVSANMVAGSISSVMTNFIPITQSWSQVSPISSLKAMRQTLKSIRNDDGVVEKSAFLTNRLRQAEKLYQSGWDKASKAVGWLMEAVDSFTSQTVWRSKYMENIKAGMTEMEAILDADQFAENVMAGRSRGNMPTIFESKNLFTRMATAFQLEVANQYGYMFKDMPQDMKNAGIGKMVKGYAAMYIGAYAYNALFSMLTGRNSAFDPIRILQGFIGGLVSDDDEEKKPMDAFMKLAEDVLQEVPFVGGFLGGGRVPISSALPYDGNVMDILSGIGKMTEGDFSDFTSEWLNPVYYLLLPMGGGQIKKTNEAIAMYKDGFKMQLRDVPGSYTNSGELRFPTEKGVWPVIRNLIFGKWSGPNAKRYIEEGRSPLSEKQIEEYQDTGMDIQQYWDYLDGLKQLNKESDSGRASINDIGDYIGGLDLTTEQKNILINNAAGRKEPIDMATYGDYPNFEEFDYGTKNPGKYAISQAVGGFEAFKEYQEDLKDLDKNEAADYINDLDIDYGMKIILYVSRYSSKASREEYGYDIVEYLNGRSDISGEQMRKILRELGFKVDWQGNVTWD